MTSAERGDDVELSRDQIERMLGRSRDTELPSRDRKSPPIDVDVRLGDVSVVHVVTRNIDVTNVYKLFFNFLIKTRFLAFFTFTTFYFYNVFCFKKNVEK